MKSEENIATVSGDVDLASSLLGTWELVSYHVEDLDTGRLIDAMGENPRGYVMFTADGWVAFNLEGSDRQPAESESDRADLMKTLVAYIGRYRIEGNQWITDVRSAWAPEWVGTEQRRTASVNNGEVKVITPWRVMPNWGDGKPSRSIIRFRKAV